MQPSADKLLAVIGIQGEVARLGLDLGAVMQLVAERVLQLAGAEGAALEMAEGDDMVYRAVAGAARRALGLRVPRQGSLAGLCVQRGEVLRCDDAETDERVDREACRRVGLRSMVVVPLTHLGQAVGVIKAMSTQPAHFSDLDVATLGLLADVVGSAMYHAARYTADDLYHRATHDALTDLPNRALFMDRLRGQLAQGDRDGHSGAVLILDMDGLKALNDSRGHRAGDEALIELGRRLSLVARVTDTVARLGGDEFGLLLRPIEGEAGLAAALQRIRSCLQEPPLLLDGEPRPDLGASLGSALFPAEGLVAEDLIDLADRRMYSEKLARRHQRASAS